jgi:hypothetical protein
VPTDPLDVDEHKVAWLAARLDPDAFKGGPGQRDHGRRIRAKVQAATALAVLWDQGVLLVDPRRLDRQV